MRKRFDRSADVSLHNLWILIWGARFFLSDYFLSLHDFHFFYPVKLGPTFGWFTLALGFTFGSTLDSPGVAAIQSGAILILPSGGRLPTGSELLAMRSRLIAWWATLRF